MDWKVFFKYSNFKLFMFLFMLIGLPVLAFIIVMSSWHSSSSPAYIGIIANILIGISNLPLLLYLNSNEHLSNLIFFIAILFDVIYVFLFSCALDYVRSRWTKKIYK